MLLLAREFFNCRLTHRGLAAVCVHFAVDNAHRFVCAGVVPAFACLVLGKASTQICGDAGIERLVGALDNIDRVHGVYTTPCSQNPYFLLFSRSYCAVRYILGYLRVLECVCLSTYIGISSNGRTEAFEAFNRGSNPCIPAKIAQQFLLGKQTVGPFATGIRKPERAPHQQMWE